MTFFSLIREIFLEDEDMGLLRSNPKNLTTHYQKELRHVEVVEVCVWWDYRILEEIIERYKYHSDRQRSTELVEVLAKCVDVSNSFGEHDDWVVVPVPMHWSRYIIRGFDHTDRLARELARMLHLRQSTLLWTRYRKRQSNLSRDKRIENKKDSFFIKNRYTIPSHVILIDDVVSSGSTFYEASSVLKKAWVENVICFAIASNAEVENP